MPTSSNGGSSASGHGAIENMALLLARLLIASLLIIAAYNKFMAFPAMVGYFGKLGLPMPNMTLPVVLAFEVLSGLALIVGFQTRIVALAVGAFVVSAALVAHNNIGDISQFNHLLKNFAILGGCLALFVSGAGGYAVDRR